MFEYLFPVIIFRLIQLSTLLLTIAIRLVISESPNRGWFGRISSIINSQYVNVLCEDYSLIISFLNSHR